jgi:hypothetical protein
MIFELVCTVGRSGGDGDDCLLVFHRARTLENPISRPLNKMRSVRLRCGLPPVTQSRDVLKESRTRIEKAWTTYYSNYHNTRPTRSWGIKKIRLWGRVKLLRHRGDMWLVTSIEYLSKGSPAFLRPAFPSPGFTSASAPKSC